MSIIASSAQTASLAMLKATNEGFQTAQKRVATGKMVFSAADDAARYRISETQASRVRQIDRINNNLSLALKTLEATDATLNKMSGLVEAAQNLARRAQSEGLPKLAGIVSSSNISASSVIGGVTAGMRLSVTSQTGANFVYVAHSSNDTWGEVVDALNRANIGVQADFVPSQTAGQTNIRFFAINNMDFTFDANSDQGIMDDLASAGWVGVGTGQTMVGVPNAQALFGVGGAVALGETGFTVSFAGNIIGSKFVGTATSLAAGSTLVLEDGEGRARTFDYTGPTTLGQVITDINAAGFDIKAELTNQTSMGANEQLRLRNITGGTVAIRFARGDFEATGSVGIAPPAGTSIIIKPPLPTDFSMRLKLGQEYDSILTELTSLIANNPVPQERNLLNGLNMAVVTDEFASNPILIQGTRLTVPGTLTLAQSGLTWGAVNNIQISAVQASQALNVISDMQSRLAVFASYIKHRYALAGETAREISAISGDLVGADMAEESAIMSALQTRQSFAVQSMAMGNQTDEGLLHLLG